jgi:hypothetical protein
MDTRQNQQSGQSRQNQGGQGQQQQLDMQNGQQTGGSGADTRFGGQIHEHMEVLDSNGKLCGTVDHADGDRIKLRRGDSPDGKHSYVLMSQVSGIEGNQVHLRERGDNDFGMEA